MWQIFLAISSITGVIRDSLTKQITQKVNPLVSLIYFYITAILTAAGISIIYYNSNPFINDYNSWIVRLFGIGFGLGVYGFFQAIRISLSKTQTYSTVRNILPIGLAYLFLGELSGLKWQNILALVIFLISILLPQFIGKKSEEEKKIEKEWILWMSLNVIFVGSGLYFVKLFTRDMLPIDVLTNQYLGSFFIIGIIVLIRNSGIIKQVEKLSLIPDKKYILLSLLNGIITAVSLFFLYYSISLAKVSIVTQMDNFIRTLAIIPIGFFIFKENKQFKLIDYISLGLAILGAILIIFS